MKRDLPAKSIASSDKKSTSHFLDFFAYGYYKYGRIEVQNPCFFAQKGLLMKKIVMTGGGTAGHVTPNIALMPALRSEGYEISYTLPSQSYPVSLLLPLDVLSPHAH